MFCTLGRDGELVRYRLNDGEGKSLVRVSGRQLSARPVRKAFFNGGRLHFVDTSGGLWRYTCKDESLVLLSDLSQLGETGFTVSTVCSFGDEVYVGSWPGPWAVFRERRPLRADRLGLPRFLPVGRLQTRISSGSGTDGYGVHMYCDKEELFTTLLMEDMPQRCSKPVRAIHTDDRGNLWIGTKGDGVIRIRDYESYAGGNIPVDHLTRFDRGKGLTSNEVFSFCSSRPGMSYGSEPRARAYLLFIRGRPDADATPAAGNAGDTRRPPDVRGERLDALPRLRYGCAGRTDNRKGRQARRDGDAPLPVPAGAPRLQ